MFSGRTTTTISAPAQAPVDFSAGKPDWREIAPLFGLIMLSLLPVGIGGALVLTSWAKYEWGGWNILGVGLGGLLVFGGGSFFWTLRTAVLYGIRRYYARVDDWHYVTIEKYEQGDGMITAQQVAEWSYSEVDMRHVLIAFAWLYLSGAKSLSIEKLTKGPLLLNVGHRSYKLMDMSQDGAASFLNLLARAGVINGRGPRSAGHIAIMDARQAFTKVLAEAARNPSTIAQEIDQ